MPSVLQTKVYIHIAMTELTLLFCMYIDIKSLTAFRCLGYFLIPKSRKKEQNVDKMDIPHVLVDGVVS